jgi:hypothetical protein
MALHHGIWAEVACYATDMHNYLVTSKSPMSSYEMFMGRHKFDRIDTLHALVKWQLWNSSKPWYAQQVTGPWQACSISWYNS